MREKLAHESLVARPRLGWGEESTLSPACAVQPNEGVERLGRALLNGDRHPSRLAASHLAANLVAILLIDAFEVRVKGVDAAQIDRWRWLLDTHRHATRSVALECIDECCVRRIGAPQATKIER